MATTLGERGSSGRDPGGGCLYLFVRTLINPPTCVLLLCLTSEIEIPPKASHATSCGRKKSGGQMDTLGP